MTNPPAAHPLLPEQRPIGGRELGGLVLALVLTAGPHALRAPWWLIAMTGALYVWRGVALVRRWPLPGHALLLLIAAAGLLGVWFEYRMIFGRVPGIVLLVLFSGLKLLETRTHRDAAIVAFLSCFLIITNFLYTQSIPVATLMVVAVFVVVTTLVACSAPARPLGAVLRTSGVLLAQAAPAAVLLFLFFPRVQGPMWGLPQDSRAGVTGLSDTMTPGAVSRLAQSDALAFRADFAGSLPSPRQRYWRGPVLWDFDGRTWRAGQAVARQTLFPALRGGSTYRYSVVLEPHQQRWMFALESAALLPQQAAFTVDRQIFATSPIRSRLRYEMVSIADGELEPEEHPALLRRALQLPSDSNPRATALARQWRRGARNAEEILVRGVDFFRGGQFSYTLEPPLLGTAPVDEFLFGTREGFCEHYASAFAFLMRAAGIPARVVTGYLGGDPNPVDGILTIRQSDAHAWVEVYLPDRGWVRVDPTATAIPGRLDLGLARSVPQGTTLPLLMRPQFEWLRTLRHRWDAIAHQWNLRVLGYKAEQQRELMSWLGMPRADWKGLAVTLFAALALLGAALLTWSMRGVARSDPVQRAWTRFCDKLARRGIARAPSEGPADFTERAARRVPLLGDAIHAIGTLYVELRYGRTRPAADVEEFRRRVREFKLT